MRRFESSARASWPQVVADLPWATAFKLLRGGAAPGCPLHIMAGCLPWRACFRCGLLPRGDLVVTAASRNGRPARVRACPACFSLSREALAEDFEAEPDNRAGRSAVRP